MKGSITDLGFIIIGVIMVGFSAFLALTILTSLNTVDVLINNDIANKTIQDAFHAFSVLDASFLFLVIGLGLASAISAFFIKTHPLFFIVSFIAWVIMFSIAAIFSNVFIEIISASVFVPISSSLSNIEFIGSNLPYLVAVLGAIIMIALYAKGGQSARPY